MRGRPPIRRRVGIVPPHAVYKPQGVPASRMEEVLLRLDGLEALRLVHIEGLSHEAGAERMGVSRQTFGRILEEAHRAVTRALVEGKMLRIGCGAYIVCPQRPPRRRGFCGGRCQFDRRIDDERPPEDADGKSDAPS